MLRYFIRIPDIAVAESDRTADRLIARGYKECTHDYYATWWALNNAARIEQLGREDVQEAIQKLNYAERVRRGV